MRLEEILKPESLYLSLSSFIQLPLEVEKKYLRKKVGLKGYGKKDMEYMGSTTYKRMEYALKCHAIITYNNYLHPETSKNIQEGIYI